MDESEEPNYCYPGTFYNRILDDNNTHFDERSLGELKIYGYTTLSFIVLFSSPFLIIPPFFMKKLKTTSRKIIAMIILSDAITSTSSFIRFLFGDVPDNYAFDPEESEQNMDANLCFVGALISKIGLSSSLIW